MKGILLLSLSLFSKHILYENNLLSIFYTSLTFFAVRIKLKPMALLAVRWRLYQVLTICVNYSRRLAKRFVLIITFLLHVFVILYSILQLFVNKSFCVKNILKQEFDFCCLDQTKPVILRRQDGQTTLLCARILKR